MINRGAGLLGGDPSELCDIVGRTDVAGFIFHFGRDLDPTDQSTTSNDTGEPRVKLPVLKLIVESRTVTHSGSG